MSDKASQKHLCGSGSLSSDLNVSQAIDSTLRRVVAQESLKNERRLAYVRATILLISAFLDTLVFFFPQSLLGLESVPPTIAFTSLSALFLSLALVYSLHQPFIHRYSKYLQVIIPIFDSLLVFAIIANISQILGTQQPQIRENPYGIFPSK